MGRQAIELDEKEIAQFEALSAFLTLEGIGDYLGISRRTLQEIRKR